MALSFYQRKKLPNEQLYSSQQPNYTSVTGAQSYAAPTPVVSNKTQPYQASGYGSQYASNQYNQPTKTTVPQAKPTTQAQPTGSGYMNTYLDRLQRLGEQQKQNQTNRANTNVQAINDSYGRLESINNQRKSNLQSGFDQYSQNVSGQIGDEEMAAKEEQDYLRELHGESLRKSAQANRESMGQWQNAFANLGSIDSSSFRNVGINQQAKFAGGQQSILKQQARDIGEVQRNLNQFKRSAKEMLIKEEQNLLSRLADIDQTLAEGSAAKEQAIREAYAAAEDAVLGIEQSLLSAEMSAAEQERQFAYNEAKDLRSFDLELAKEGLKNAQSNASIAQNNNKALTMVNNILGGDYQSITGTFQVPRFMDRVHGGSAQVRADMDGLKSLLSLAKRGELKGSGQVSDFETKMLEKAALAGLDTNLPEDEFYRRLQQLQADLMQGGATSSNTNSSMSNVVIAPDGEQVMIVD